MRLPRKLYNVALFAASLSTIVVDTEALPPQISEPATDELKAECPKECGIPNLNKITELIMNKEVFLTSDSCVKAPNATADLSFKFQYTFKEASAAEELDMKDKSDRRTQSIDKGPPIVNMPPIDGFEQTIYGWSIDADKDSKEGSCFTAPNKIAGPFPLANLTSCVHDFEFACYRIKNGPPGWGESKECPCYDKDEIEGIKRKLMLKTYDPDFQVDMNLSCKIPSQNNHIPYGIYTKPNGISATEYGSKLRLGVDMKLFDPSKPVHQVLNQCHNKDKEVIAPVSFIQHGQCKSLMKDLCIFLNTIYPEQNPGPPSESPKKPVPSLCSDNVNFRHQGKTWKTCDYMVKNTSRWRRARNCRKYDASTKKYVFQQCRESCRMCTCMDNKDFSFGEEGYPKYNCAWVNKLDAEKKASICLNKEVSANCIAACNSKCCKNSLQFSYWKRIEYDENDVEDNMKRRRKKWEKRTCANVSNANWKEECETRSVAMNCPMICRKCAIQPRM